MNDMRSEPSLTNQTNGSNGSEITSFTRAGLLMWFTVALVVAVGIALYMTVDEPEVVAIVFVMPALLWVFVLFLGSSKVVVDDNGVYALGGRLLKLLAVDAKDIVSAEPKIIKPLRYGGWGLRISPAGTSFITRSGPGLVVHRHQGKPRIYSVATTADAEQMASRLNQMAISVQSAVPYRD